MNDADEFVNQPEPVYGLRSRCVDLARTIKHAIEYPEGEGGAMTDIAEALFDLVTLGRAPNTEPLLPMNRLEVACYVPLSAALERDTGRHGEVDIPLDEDVIETLPPEVRTMLLESWQIRHGLVRLPGLLGLGSDRLELRSESQAELVVALKAHADELARKRAEADALLVIDPAHAIPELVERAEALMWWGRGEQRTALGAWCAAAKALRTVAPVLEGDPTAPTANMVSLQDLPFAWAQRAQAWNTAVQEAGQARAAAKAAEKRAADLVLLRKRGTESQRDRYRAGVLPKAELEKLRDEDQEQETNRLLPLESAWGLGLSRFDRITLAELAAAHDHPLDVREASFRCEAETEITADQWQTMELVRRAHPTAVVTLLRHEGTCLQHAGCGVSIIRYGVRAELQGFKREYAVKWASGAP